MNRIILYILSVIALTSCTSRTANNANGSDTSYQDSLYAALREREMQDSLMRESYKYINSVKGHEEKDFITGRFVDNNIDTLYFLGHYIRCGEDSIYAEIERSFINDPNVSFDRQTGNIAICGTDFHVNPGRKSLVLMSPVQPETRGIRKVRNYISKFHGKENYEEPEHYFTRTIVSASDFVGSLKSLLAKYPSVSLQSLGFPASWEQEPLWK